jgi:lipoprotein-releasing system ATP-binding protein
LLEAKGIHKTYNDGKKDLQVLKGVDLDIKKGSFCAVVGPSGAGKSTLLHIFGGLDSPTKGRVNFEGQDIYSLQDAELAGIRNKKIGFVFQFYHLLPEFNVLENVMMPGLICPGADRKAVKNLALGFLDEVGLGGRTNHFPSQLSGGEKQRVAIVRALMNSPSLLLCDEPTGNLDSNSGGEIISLIKKISAKNNMSVVLVTHNLELTKAADAVYHLRDGLLIN